MEFSCKVHLTVPVPVKTDIGSVGFRRPCGDGRDVSRGGWLSAAGLSKPSSFSQRQNQRAPVGGGSQGGINHCKMEDQGGTGVVADVHGLDRWIFPVTPPPPHLPQIPASLFMRPRRRGKFLFLYSRHLRLFVEAVGGLAP